MTTPSQGNPESLSLAAAEQLEAIYVQFKQKWEDGQPLRLEEILKDVPAGLREALLQELLPLEVNYRKRRGVRPTAEDYLPLAPEQGELLCSMLATGSALERAEAAASVSFQRAGSSVTLPPVSAASETERARSAWPEVPGYQIEAELGKGGMGVVYRARHQQLARTVALKMIRGGADADPAELTRFRTEARAIAQLQHPHIVQIHEVGEHNGLPFFSLEFCPGGSLATRLRESVLPPREAARLVEKVARGMQAAHAVGIVHRDLKPANVLLTQDGTPRVADFGLARKLDEEGQTVTGMVMGTPSYMAPEQANGQSKDVGSAADVYALGAILYECLTGRPPFKAASAWETVKQVLTAEPVPPRQLDRSLPRDLETICLKCLQKEPERRYATAWQLAEDLARFQGGLPVLARPVGRLERRRWCRRSPVVASLVAAVTVLLVAVAGVSSYSAFSLEAALTQTQTAEREARADQRLARLREAEALIGKAHGIRTSRRSGQRFAALAALEEANAIGRELGQPREWFDPVRNEVINALALPDLHITHTFDGYPPGTANADLSEDFELYVRITGQGECSVRRVADDVEVALLPALGEGAHAHFGPGRLLVVNGNLGVQLWNLTEPKADRRFNESRGYMCIVRPDGRLSVLGYADGRLAVFRTDTGICQYRLAANGIMKYPHPCLHPTEPIVAVCSYWSPLLQVRDLRTGAVLISPTLPWGGSWMCEWSPDGRTLAVSAGDSGLIHLYSFDPAAPGLSLRRTLRASGNGGTVFHFNPAGDRLVSRGFDDVVYLFDCVAGRLLFSTFSRPAGGWFLRFDQTGRRLAGSRVGNLLQQIGVWSVADGREFRVLLHNGPGRRLPDWYPGNPAPAVHPDGCLATLALTDGLALFDLETEREVAFVPVSQGGGIPCFDAAANLFTSGPTGLFRWPVRTDPTRPNRMTLGPREKLPFEGSYTSRGQD